MIAPHVAESPLRILPAAAAYLLRILPIDVPNGAPNRAAQGLRILRVDASDGLKTKQKIIHPTFGASLGGIFRGIFRWPRPVASRGASPARAGGPCTWGPADSASRALDSRAQISFDSGARAHGLRGGAQASWARSCAAASRRASTNAKETARKKTTSSKTLSKPEHDKIHRSFAWRPVQTESSASRQVGRPAGRQVGKPAGRQIGASAGQEVGRSASWQVGRPPGRRGLLGLPGASRGFLGLPGASWGFLGPLGASRARNRTSKVYLYPVSIR